VFLVLDAATLIGVLMLVSLGMGIIFGMMNVINLAHGEFVPLGAYLTATTSVLTGSFWLGLLAGMIGGALAGLIIEVALVRHLYRRPVDTIIATLGVSYIAQVLFDLVFGPSPISLPSPIPGQLSIFGTLYPADRICVALLSFAIVGALTLAYRRTELGLDFRAGLQDANMARVLGVDVGRTYRLAFTLGAGLAAFAGGLLAPMTSIVPTMGLPYLIKSFFVVIVGGAGSIFGVLAGSSFIGGLNTLFSYSIGGAFPEALVLAVALVVVRLRPRGLVTGK
jgi:urea transport system permease protein